jgi:acyl carrier protein
MEKKIREFISELIKLERNAVDSIDLDADLIEFGLDSLNSIELIVRLEDEFDIEIDDNDLIIDNINTLNKLINIVQNKQ